MNHTPLPPVYSLTKSYKSIHHTHHTLIHQCKTQDQHRTPPTPSDPSSVWMYHETNREKRSPILPLASQSRLRRHRDHTNTHCAWRTTHSLCTDLLFPTHSISDAAPPCFSSLCWSLNDRLFAQCFSRLDSQWTGHNENLTHTHTVSKLILQ